MNHATTEFDWLTDLDPIFAVEECWKNGSYQEEACCHLTYEPDGPFAIVSGSSLLAKHVRTFRFDGEIIARLGRQTNDRGQSLFDESLLNHLQRMHLRIRVYIPNEGTLLLPGEPLMIVIGPLDQIRLLESAFMELIWKSSHWATLAATERWEKGDFLEEDTPNEPVYAQNPAGWRIRAHYMGGGGEEKGKQKNLRKIKPTEGLHVQWRRKASESAQTSQTLEQIRRLFKGSQPLGDVWMPESMTGKASVSKTSIGLKNVDTQKEESIKFTRFLNLYQLVVFKGHSVYTSPRLPYRRQRTLHNLEYFAKTDLSKYPKGWYLAGS